MPRCNPRPLSSSTPTYILVAHGSRDPRSQLALDGLLAAVRVLLAAGGTVGERADSPAAVPTIAAATLEFAPTPLPEAIATVARTTGARVVRLVPLFLQAGVHAREDVPAAAKVARQLLGDAVAIEVLPPIGSQPSLAGLLAAQFERLQDETTSMQRLLMAHGSRRDGGNDPVTKLAAGLGATLAFWAIAPDLETQIASLVAKQTRAIAIAPYFLFPGRITDAIAARVARLQAAYPDTLITAAPPLSATPDLAELIVDLCRS